MSGYNDNDTSPRTAVRQSTTFLIGSGAIGGQAFYDDDDDGMRDDNTHINGVTDINVWLFSCDPPKTLAHQTTSSNGIYRFVDLAQGSYYIIAQPPWGYRFSTNEGIFDDTSDKHLESMIDPYSGRTICFELNEGEKTMDWSFGLHRPSSDGPSLQPPSTNTPTSTHSKSPSLEISNRPSVISHGPLYYPRGSPTSGSPTATNPTLVRVRSHGPSEMLADSIPINSPTMIGTLNPTLNHSFDPPRITPLNIMSNPVTTHPPMDPVIDHPTVTNSLTVQNSVPTKTESPRDSSLSEPSTGSKDNDGILQTWLTNTNTTNWDLTPPLLVNSTSVKTNGNNDNGTRGTILGMGLCVVLVSCVAFTAILRKRKIRSVVKGNNLGAKASRNLSCEQHDKGDNGRFNSMILCENSSEDDSEDEETPPPCENYRQNRIQSHCTTISRSNNSNSDEIASTASWSSIDPWSSQDLITKTEKVESLEHLHHANDDSEDEEAPPPHNLSVTISRSNSPSHDAIASTTSRSSQDLITKTEKVESLENLHHANDKPEGEKAPPPHNLSVTISGSNNSNYDAIASTTSRSSQVLINKTEKVRSLENLHRAFSIAIRSYPKHSKQWLQLNSHMDQVLEELSVALQDIEVHPNTIQVMAPPCNLGLVGDKSHDGGPVYIRVTHPHSPLQDQLQLNDKVNAIDDEDVRRLSSVEDGEPCGIAMKEVGRISIVRDNDDDVLAEYGDGSNHADDQSPPTRISVGLNEHHSNTSLISALLEDNFQSKADQVTDQILANRLETEKNDDTTSIYTYTPTDQAEISDERPAKLLSSIKRIIQKLEEEMVQSTLKNSEVVSGPIVQAKGDPHGMLTKVIKSRRDEPRSINSGRSTEDPQRSIKRAKALDDGTNCNAAVPMWARSEKVEEDGVKYQYDESCRIGSVLPATIKEDVIVAQEISGHPEELDTRMKRISRNASGASKQSYIHVVDWYKPKRSRRRVNSDMTHD